MKVITKIVRRNRNAVRGMRNSPNKVYEFCRLKDNKLPVMPCDFFESITSVIQLMNIITKK